MAVAPALSEGAADSRSITSVRGRNPYGSESGFPVFHPSNGEAHRIQSPVSSGRFVRLDIAPEFDDVVPSASAAHPRSPGARARSG